MTYSLIIHVMRITMAYAMWNLFSDFTRVFCLFWLVYFRLHCARLPRARTSWYYSLPPAGAIRRITRYRIIVFVFDPLSNYSYLTVSSGIQSRVSSPLIQYGLGRVMSESENTFYSFQMICSGRASDLGIRFQFLFIRPKLQKWTYLKDIWKSGIVVVRILNIRVFKTQGACQ